MTMTDPVAIAAGLRRLADFVEAQGDNAPTVHVIASVGYHPTIAIRKLAVIAKAGDEVLPAGLGMDRLAIRFGELVVDLSGPSDVFGSTRETVQTVTELAPFTRAELIARGEAVELDMAEGPF